MATYAYIRVSDSNKQDNSSQLESITAYCEENSIKDLVWVSEGISGSKTAVEDRKLSNILNKLDRNDKLICTEISRLGREKAMAVISIINRIIEEKGAELHLTYTNSVINSDNVDNAEILFTVVGASFVARQEAIRRSDRAKAGCAKRESQGLANGRQVGQVVKSKLDQHAPLIVAELGSGTAKTEIIKLIEEQGTKVTRQHLYRWINRRLPKTV